MLRFTKKTFFSDNFNRTESSDVGLSWVDNHQFSISNSNTLLTTNAKETELVSFTGTTAENFADTVRVTLDGTTTVRSVEEDAFFRVAVGQYIRGYGGEFDNFVTVTSKINNQEIVVSDTPNFSNPKDLLRPEGVLDSEVHITFTPLFTYNCEVDKSHRIISRKQPGVNSKYFVEIFAEFINDDSVNFKLYANLHKRLSMRETNDKIHEKFVILPIGQYRFEYSTVSHGEGTVLSLTAVNVSTGTRTFFFDVVDGEPELQFSGQVGLSHVGIVSFDDFVQYSVVKPPKKKSKILYVDAITGSDSNNGDYGTPLLTIQAAVIKAKLLENTLVLIKPGTYIEDISIVDKSVSLIGFSDTPTIQGTVTVRDATDITLSDLRLFGDNYSDKKGLDVYNAINLFINHVEFAEFAENAASFERIVSFDFSNFIVKDCCYSNLVSSIPVGSTDLQTAAILMGFIYKGNVSNGKIDTVAYRGGQAIKSWATLWERLTF